MKKKIMTVLAMTVLLLSACGGPAGTENSTETEGSSVTMREETEPGNLTEEVRTAPVLVLEVNGVRIQADPAENASADAFIERLGSGALTLELHEYGGFEKVGPLPFSLPRNDSRITTEPGDIILYNGDQLTVLYGRNTWSYTRLAKIRGMTEEALAELLGEGDVTAVFYLEQGE